MVFVACVGHARGHTGRVFYLSPSPLPASAEVDVVRVPAAATPPAPAPPPRAAACRSSLGARVFYRRPSAPTQHLGLVTRMVSGR